jgi:hypothetical protein
MRLRLWLPALSLLTLCACSTTPPAAPAEIPKPPVALLGRCPAPEDLPDAATANELAEFAAGALKFAACERSRSIGLLEAWP